MDQPSQKEWKRAGRGREEEQHRKGREKEEEEEQVLVVKGPLPAQQ